VIKLIAEIGINHNGDIGIAKRLIDAALLAGFDYVKFQKRTPHLCVPEHKKSEIRETPWGKMTYLEYRQRIEFGEKEYDAISDYCAAVGMGWFASAWDIPSAEFLAARSLMVKIPSAKITDDELLRYCRLHFPYLIMSTGMSSEEEVRHAIDIAEPDAIFHTHSAYPAPVEELRLEYISWLKRSIKGIEYGYSGHEYGISTTLAAAAMGVDWIERHITLDHDMWGSDQKSSVDLVGMVKLVRSVRAIEKAMAGFGPRVVLPSEEVKRRDLRN
jgi:sialic acid synthase SpsE